MYLASNLLSAFQTPPKNGKEIIELGEITVSPADSVKSLGTIFDTNFSMSAQVNNVIGTYYMYNHHIL